jgi:hypothetical protein
MTPQEKARFLIDKFNWVVLDTHLGGSNRRVKACAIISISQTIQQLQEIENSCYQDFLSTEIKYLEIVKQEIEKL